MSAEKYKLVFFVPATPPETLQEIKQAIFDTGAGTYGDYTRCCFQSPGIGEFKPGAPANPAIGELGKVEQVGELRFETICSDRAIAKRAVEALKRTHPYEQVAYEVYKIEDL